MGLLLIMTKAHPIFERVFKKYDWLNNVVQENLLGIRVVKSFVREDHEKEKFGKVSKEIYMDFSKAERILAFNMPLMQLCVYACILAVSWIGAHLIVGGSMTTGQLTSMFSYIMMILMSLMMLLHGAGHDHHGPGLCRADHRAAQRGERPEERPRPHRGGQGRLRGV